jgi:hypothetical protein
MKVDRKQLITKIELFIVNKQQEITDNQALKTEYEKAKKAQDANIAAYAKKVISKAVQAKDAVKYGNDWSGNFEIEITIPKDSLPKGLFDPLPKKLVDANNFKFCCAEAEIDQAKRNLELMLMSPSDNIDLKPGAMKDFLEYV